MRICQYYAKGECNYKNCSYAHPPEFPFYIYGMSINDSSPNNDIHPDLLKLNVMKDERNAEIADNIWIRNYVEYHQAFSRKLKGYRIPYNQVCLPFNPERVYNEVESILNSNKGNSGGFYDSQGSDRNYRNNFYDRRDNRGGGYDERSNYDYKNRGRNNDYDNQNNRGRYNYDSRNNRGRNNGYDGESNRGRFGDSGDFRGNERRFYDNNRRSFDNNNNRGSFDDNRRGGNYHQDNRNSRDNRGGGYNQGGKPYNTGSSNNQDDFNTKFYSSTRDNKDSNSQGSKDKEYDSPPYSQFKFPYT